MAAGGKKGEAPKKVKYNNKSTVKHKRVLSGLRHKRVSWLDSPRLKTIYRKKRPLRDRLYALNTPKRIAHYLKNLREERKENKRVSEPWLRTLADQGRITVELATELNEFIFKESGYTPENLNPKTYERLLEMWMRRKSIEKSTEVFEMMKQNGKVTDYAYSIYCRTLAASGQLEKAKEMLVERLNNVKLVGNQTVKAMVNCVAAEDFQEGEKLFKRWGEIRERAKQTLHRNSLWLGAQRQKKKMEKRGIASEIEGKKEETPEEVQKREEAKKETKKARNERRKAKKALKVAAKGTGNNTKEEEDAQKKANIEKMKKLKEAKDNREKKLQAEKEKEDKLRENIQNPTPDELEEAKRVLKFDDEMYSTMIGYYLKNGEYKKAEGNFQERKREFLAKWDKGSDANYAAKLKAYEQALKIRNAKLKEYEQKVRELKGNPDPQVYQNAVKAGLKRPNFKKLVYPQQHKTAQEFFQSTPIPFTAHVLRPILDRVAKGEKINESWVQRIGEGLKHNDARLGIKSVVQAVAAQDKEKYEVLKGLLKNMGLNYEELTRLPVHKVPQKAPVKRDRSPAIKKWWKVGGKLPEDE